ncbi:MAG: sigma-70 family RNA polymerase sigma factor [Clostridiales bacterium]|nr:sigma-70 family RNA polymerase sigma factor [Clostridiales bacterium]
MTNEELATEIQAGKTELYAQLWEQVRRWVACLASRWYRAFDGARGVEVDDLISSGYLAMVAAVDTFDTGADGSFIGWFTFYLKSEFSALYGLKTSRQREDPMHRAVSLSAPVPGADDLTMEDMVADPVDPYEDPEQAMYLEQLHDALEEAMATIPGNLSDALRRRFYQGQTLSKAAKDIGIAPENVRQRENKALRNLRNPKIARGLRPFLYPDSDVYAAGLRRGNSTEAAAIRMIEGEHL